LIPTRRARPRGEVWRRTIPRCARARAAWPRAAAECSAPQLKVRCTRILPARPPMSH
jgi:hypothetical protein